MKRPVLLFLIISAIFLSNFAEVQAQLWKRRRVEAVAGIGPSFFFGDVGGYSKKENVLGIKDIT
ncbi:MAG TPA: hypothetical protein VHO50_03900, partial [Bacteroidales bacterium]|nr:hypothetical protein [Bacteroidales bacterium]